VGVTAVLLRMQIRASSHWWRWCWTKESLRESSPTMKSPGLLCRETAGFVSRQFCFSFPKSFYFQSC